MHEGGGVISQQVKDPKACLAGTRADKFKEGRWQRLQPRKISLFLPYDKGRVENKVETHHLTIRANNQKGREGSCGQEG